jgi:hypothetical protein
VTSDGGDKTRIATVLCGSVGSDNIKKANQSAELDLSEFVAHLTLSDRAWY